MEELIKLMKENPELEVVPIVYTNDIDEGFRFTKGKFLSCEIDDIYEYDGHVFTWSDNDGLDLLEYLWDETERSSFLSDKEESDAEIEISARARFKAVKWKKVIILWIRVE